jgi:hypothetical protein
MPLWLMLLWLSGWMIALAQPEPSLTVMPEQPLIGDVLTVTLSVPHSHRTRLIMPELPDPWGAFEVVSRPVLETEPLSAQQQISQVTWQVQAFSLDPLNTPPVTVQLADPAGNLVPVVIDSLTVGTRSLLEQTIQEGNQPNMRDIKAPLTFTATLTVWQRVQQRIILTVLALLLFVLLGVIYLRYFAKTLTEPHKKTALEQLQSTLQTLADKATWTRADMDAISYYVRHYLALRHKLPAHGETSQTLHHTLRQARITPEFAKHIVNTLLRCDAARFAARELSQADIALIRHTLMGLANMPAYAYSPDHPSNQPSHPATSHPATATFQEQPS